MSTILSNPVKDLKGKVLINAGVDVLDWAKKGVPTAEYLKKKVKFRDVPTLLDDMNAVFELEPYKKVLSNWVKSFDEVIGESWAPGVFFDELKYVKMRDPYAYQHMLVVAVVGTRLLEMWIKTPPTIKKAFQALLFHDLGRTRLSPNILEKTDDLDEMDRKAIYEHSLIGFALNANYWGDANHMCAEVALQHNENRLGSGYPQGLKTNSLIIDILGMVDRFDAFVSTRPFRFKKFSVREAGDFLRRDGEDGKIEMDVFKGFISLLRGQSVKNLKKLKLGTIGRPEKPNAV